MSYRTLWIIGLSIEAVLMGIALLVVGEDASLGAGIAWGLTQMPALAIGNRVLDDEIVPIAGFYGFTFVLQSVFFGSALCLIKWVKVRFVSVSNPREEEKPSQSTTAQRAPRVADR